MAAWVRRNCVIKIAIISSGSEKEMTGKVHARHDGTAVGEGEEETGCSGM